MEGKGRYGRMLVNLLVALAVILLLIFALPKVLVFFMPFVVGWLISLIAHPLVRFLEKRVKIKRKAGSALIIIVVLAAVCALLYFVIAALGREVMNFIEDAPELFASIQAQATQLGDRVNGIYERLPQSAQEVVDSLIVSLSSAAKGVLENLKVADMGGAGHMVTGVVDVLLAVIVALLSAYFFVADREELSRKIREMMPQGWFERYLLIKNNFFLAVGGYFKAQFKIMLVLIVIIFVGLEILQVNYSFLLAMLIAALDVLPVLGTGTILWPWMAWELASGHYFRLIGLFAIYLICQVVKQVLQPKMVGDSVGLSPLLTLFLLYVGYKFGGVMGMIIGIPVGMVIINLYRAGMFDRVIRDIKTVAGDINRYRKGE